MRHEASVSRSVFDEYLIEESHRDEVSTRRRRRVLSTLLSGGRRSSTLLNGRRGHHATYLFQAQHCKHLLWLRVPNCLFEKFLIDFVVEFFFDNFLFGNLDSMTPVQSPNRMTEKFAI